jgi:hypothetical protein
VILDLLPVAGDFAALTSDFADSPVDFFEAWNVAGVQTYNALTGNTKKVGK